MEEYLKSTLIFIEKYKVKSLNYLPLHIETEIIKVETTLKEFNPFLIFLCILLTFYIFRFILSNITSLFKLDFYINIFFYLFKNFSFVKKNLLKERKKIYKLTMDAFRVNEAKDLNLPSTINTTNKRTSNSNTNKLQFKNHGLGLMNILKAFEDISVVDKSSFAKENKQTGCIYTNNPDADTLGEIASELYSHIDYANPKLFNSVKRIENNLLDIMLELFNANIDEGCGYVSTGGTESIMYALYGAKNFAAHKGICPLSHPDNSNYYHNGYSGCSYDNYSIPEVIAPVTIHAAVDKACMTFGLKLVKVGLNKTTYQMDLSEVKSKINSNTVLIVGSAYNFPHGIADDIESLSKIALKNNLLLHVDGCMGGFMTCFYNYLIKNNYVYKFNSGNNRLEKSNEKIDFSYFKDLDFKNPGVTSISCDVHKYGMTQKGTSVLMFKNKFYKGLMCASFLANDGLLLSAGIKESRPASLIASAFMVLIYNGKNAYIDQARRILSINHRVKKEINDSNKYKKFNLQIIGNPIGSIFAIKGERVGVIHSELIKRGWKVNLVNNPLAIAFCITGANIELFENGKFFSDFEDSYDYVYNNNLKQLSGLAAMYGVAGSVPENIINMNMDCVMDIMIDTKEDTDRIIKKLDASIN